MIPVFAYGPGAENFGGLYENTGIFDRISRDWRIAEVLGSGGSGGPSTPRRPSEGRVVSHNPFRSPGDGQPDKMLVRSAGSVR